MKSLSNLAPLRLCAFALIAHVFLTCSLLGASPDVHVGVTHFDLTITPGSRTVTLTPTSSGTIRSGVSDAAGDVTFSNVQPGDYGMSISGSLVSVTLSIPSSHARFEARDLVVGGWTGPTTEGSAASKENLRAWSLLTPDGLVLPSYLSLSGQTNRLTIDSDTLKLDGEEITGGPGGSQTPWVSDIDSAGFNLTNSGNYFNIIDLLSNVRLFIQQDGMGSGATELHDASGNSRFVANQDGSGAGSLTLYDSGGNERFLLDQDGSGAGNSVLIDPSNNNRIYLEQDGAGAGDTTILDAAGNDRLAFNQNGDGSGETKIFDANQKVRFAAENNGSNEGATYLKDANGVVRFSALRNSDNSGDLELKDGLGFSRVVISQNGTNQGATTLKDAFDADQMTIDATGVTAINGIGSTATTAAASITATGWTNTFGVNAVVYLDGTGVTYIVKNNEGTAVYTNAATVTHATVILQPSGAVVIDGTGVSGRATPF